MGRMILPHGRVVKRKGVVLFAIQKKKPAGSFAEGFGEALDTREAVPTQLLLCFFFPRHISDALLGDGSSNFYCSSSQTAGYEEREKCLVICSTALMCYCINEKHCAAQGLMKKLIS